MLGRLKLLTAEPLISDPGSFEAEIAFATFKDL